MVEAENGPASEFWITNGFAESHLGWPLDKLQKTRNRAIKDGWIERIYSASKNRNAVYRWGPAAKSQSPPPQLPPRKLGLAQCIKQSRICRRERPLILYKYSASILLAYLDTSIYLRRQRSRKNRGGVF
jgi:hypothetical protein